MMLMAADSEGGFKPPTRKHILEQETNVSKCLQSNTIYSGGGERRLQEDSSVSASLPKKLRVRNQSRISIIWRGVIQMFSLKPFAAKAYPVSGFSYHLFQAVPDLLQSRGFILPEEVWAYLDSVWPANTKEMALIKFHPSSTKGCSPYSMLYSYLNNRQRYGIVDSDQMEMFMVPLAAYQPVPSKLHPLGGPGLDPCHPSLLLGLILPKRPPTAPHPLPKTRRKSVTFKDDIEIQYIPVLSPADTHPMQPLQPLSLIEPLWGCNCPVAVIPEHKPLFSEELGSKMVHGGLCSLPQETAGGGTGQSLSDIILQLQCDPPCLEGQLGSRMLETLGAQLQQAGICADHNPQCIGNSLGLPPSETVFPNQCGVDGGHGANVLDASLLLRMLCPEAVPPAKASEAPSLLQIPSATPVAADSLMEEALSLIQYVTQLQPHTTPNQEPAMSLETPPVLSQALTGAEFPAVYQNDDNGYAHIQRFLSSLGGQTQSPAT
ncbi:uncharacterized protein LOC125435200 [Sphaerodactylus townsendi]|uniref:uncharacterized protein LOC125435200 n=1 Tax=Sphaerodactylus townsendi TaxID=933632 RepID=UPI002026752F|nr:uncharacterized protein LOC125435200 [Sphaerodactylus townsendi]